ncbi:MAG: hypothetical protein A2046_05330 [Bacteroidetes bacterium GWA2_30_7]|nr:MAG: hypothetical protein A2046_05330 [Bacteroidetes bacterium GWA2_30_7]
MAKKRLFGVDSSNNSAFSWHKHLKQIFLPNLLKLILMKLLFTLFLFAISFCISFSQDTITVMHYNLLGYSTSYISCNQTNNNIDTKEAGIKLITKDIMPDIFTTNEFGDDITYVNRMKNNVLNTDGVTYYESSTYAAEANTSIINMLFYNKNKFSKISEQVVNHSVSSVRKTKIVKLKYLSSNPNDNIYLVCVLTHLKAGSTVDDIADRETMTSEINDWLTANYNTPGNYFIMGDFNVYTSSESGFQNLVNNSNSNIKFYDPINNLGDWNNNSSYKTIHTQSTHSDDNNCAAPGGMDDRFDFILMSNPVINSSLKIAYLNNSYKAYGQDGYHFNKSINDGANGVVSAAISNALYTVSDHLPVTMKIIMNPIVGIEKVLTTSSLTFNFTNPLSKGNLDLNIVNNHNYFGNIKIEICSIIGQTVNSENYELSNGLNRFSIDLSNVKSGIYLIKITDKFNGTNTQKLIIK